MSALAAQTPSSAFTYGFDKNAPFLRDVITKPLSWEAPVMKTTFAPTVGVREIAPGPPSPPAGLLQLQPLPVSPKKKKKVNGTVNGGVQANGRTNGAAVGKKVSEGESEEEEEEEEEEEGPEGNARAGPSQIRSAPVGTPVKPHINGATSTTPTATPLANGKGKGKAGAEADAANATPAHDSEPRNGTAVDTHGPASATARHLAASKRPHAKQELCTPLSDQDLAWPVDVRKLTYGAGLHNPSMACYVNSTMQVMLHTPPLLSEAYAHGKIADCVMQHTPAKGQQKGFCMMCHVRAMTMKHADDNKRSYAPSVHMVLPNIKKGFSRNRQEDTQEFFRFAVDALQNQALFGLPKTLPDKIKHTSWVHRIWGGRVRSRVLCLKCKKPSDTFDTYLDLALDCGPKNSRLDGILRGFCKEDKLEGDNKYHCENCKSKSNATKSFRIAEAPPILTLHLKRFMTTYNSYNGRAKAHKFNGKVDFDEYLDIAPYMIQGSPTKYRLFGVTCHRGHELRYGHYTAYVKNPNGKWYQADDDDMSPVPLQRVLNDSTAYLLSYMRVPEGEAGASSGTTPRKEMGTANGEGSGKRGRDAEESEEEEEEEEEPARTLVAKRPMIGPVRPSPASNGFANGHAKGQMKGIGNGFGASSEQGPSLFESSFDQAKRQTTPVSPPRSAADQEDDDDEDRNAASSSRFGAALTSSSISSGNKAKFTPLPANNFYGLPRPPMPLSPISRPRDPGPDSHSHSHHSHSHSHSQHSHSSSPRGKKHKNKNKKHRGGRDGEGKHGSGGGKRSTAAPYKAGGVIGGFGGMGKGTHGRMKARQ